MKKMKLTKSDILRISGQSKDNYNYLLRIYKHVFKNWDKIKQVTGHLGASETTDTFILENAPDKDRESIIQLHMFWLNKGFSLLNNVSDWYIYPNKCKVVY